MSEAGEQLERRARAFHEAGHVFALIEQGKRVFGATIDERGLEDLRRQSVNVHEDEQGATVFEDGLTPAQQLVGAFAAVRAELRIRPKPDALPDVHGQARTELYDAIVRMIAAADLRAQQILDKRWSDIERFAEELLEKGTVNLPRDLQEREEPA